MTRVQEHYFRGGICHNNIVITIHFLEEKWQIMLKKKKGKKGHLRIYSNCSYKMCVHLHKPGEFKCMPLTVIYQHAHVYRYTDQC